MPCSIGALRSRAAPCNIYAVMQNLSCSIVVQPRGSELPRCSLHTHTHTHAIRSRGASLPPSNGCPRPAAGRGALRASPTPPPPRARARPLALLAVAFSPPRVLRGLASRHPRAHWHTSFTQGRARRLSHISCMPGTCAAARRSMSRCTHGRCGSIALAKGRQRLQQAAAHHRSACQCFGAWKAVDCRQVRTARPRPPPPPRTQWLPPCCGC